MSDSKDSMSLPQRIPKALLITMGGQLLLGVWMISKYDSKIEDNTRRITLLEAHEELARNPIGDLASRLARIEGTLGVMSLKDARASAILDSIVDTQRRESNRHDPGSNEQPPKR